MKRRSRGDVAFSDEEERPDIWQRLSRVLLVLVFLLAMSGILSLFLPELDRQEAIEKDLAALAAVRDAKVAERDKLMARLEWMRTDAEFLETVARDKLDLYREGEQVIRIEDGAVRERRTVPVGEAPILKPAPAVGD